MVEVSVAIRRDRRERDCCNAKFLKALFGTYPGLAPEGYVFSRKDELARPAMPQAANENLTPSARTIRHMAARQSEREQLEAQRVDNSVCFRCGTRVAVGCVHTGGL